MPQIKDTDFLQLSARIRAMETRMLTRERRERMLEAKSTADALRVLSECCYNDVDEDSFNDVLATEHSSMLNDLSTACPMPKLIEFFRIKYDYHNLKTLIKGEALSLDVRRMLSDAGRISAKKTADAFELNDLSLLPEDMAEAGKQGREVMAATGDPQLCDLALDRACYARMRKAAQNSASGFLQGYFKVMADHANLRTIVRIRRRNKGYELLRYALLEGGNVSLDTLMAQAVANVSLKEIFSGTAFEQAAEMSEESLTAFERECDNVLNRYLTSARFVPFGDAVVVAYVAAKEAELSAVRIILSGKTAGISNDEIRERLRDSYV